MGFIIVILPFLQAISACITIWGFANTSSFGDAVVTYGAVGDDGSPDAMMWINSVGSIVVGIGGFVFTHFMKYKTGQQSELYLAVIGLLKAPTNPFSVFRVVFVAVCLLEDAGWIKDDNDKQAIEFFKNWLSTKIAGASIPAQVIPKPALPAHTV